jgi:hypothetical protein
MFRFLVGVIGYPLIVNAQDISLAIVKGFIILTITTGFCYLSSAIVDNFYH